LQRRISPDVFICGMSRVQRTLLLTSAHDAQSTARTRGFRDTPGILLVQGRYTAIYGGYASPGYREATGAALCASAGSGGAGPHLESTIAYEILNVRKARHRMQVRPGRPKPNGWLFQPERA
jgi:hypothetical protein